MQFLQGKGGHFFFKLRVASSSAVEERLSLVCLSVVKKQVKVWLKIEQRQVVVLIIDDF